MAYIDKEVLKQSIKIMPRTTHPELVLYSSVQKIISNAPAADVVEVRHGKWIDASKKANVGMKCSLCGARIKYSEFFNGNHNYCHKCGAKMDGKDGEQ